MFAGVVSFDGGAVARQYQDRVHAVIARHGTARRVSDQSTGHAVVAALNLKARRLPKVLFASSSRLDNREEIAAACGAAPHASEPECIQRMFEARGDVGIARLLGEFAFAHWNEDSATLTLARDYLGRRSLFYHVGQGFVAFASHLADLLALPDVPKELDERRLANFLALNHRESEATFYRGVTRVSSRSVVRIGPRGVERRNYWSPNLDAPPPYNRDADYIERARELFDAAVARTLRGVNRAALQLSGGFDSSAVAATAARLGTAEITGYTGVPPDGFDRPVAAGKYADERSKVEALGRMYPALRLNFVAPRGAHSRVTNPVRLFADVPLPHRDVSNLGWFGPVHDAIAADRQKLVLNGAMGNLTLSWEGRFSLAVLARHGRLFKLLSEARAISRTTRQSLPRVLWSEAAMLLLPAAARRAVTRMRGFAVEDVSAFSLLNPDAIEAFDIRRQWRDDGFDPTYPLNGTGVRLRARLIFDHMQYGRDLGAMFRSSAGCDFRDPYADRELVEFCLSAPETLYRRGGVRRWFARKVFADRLPQEILDETRRGEQALNWFESLDARKSIIAEEVERIESSPLASRLIDLPRLKRLIADWPADAHEAEGRALEYRYGLDRAVHLGQFVRWVERGNS